MPSKKTPAKSKATRTQVPSSKRSKQEGAPPRQETRPRRSCKTCSMPAGNSAQRALPLVISSSQEQYLKEAQIPPWQGDNSTERTKPPRRYLDNAPNPNPTPKQLITYLLFPFSIPLAQPAYELTFSSTNKSSKTYSHTPPTNSPPSNTSTWPPSSQTPYPIGSASEALHPPQPALLTHLSRFHPSVGENRVWEALEAARTYVSIEDCCLHLQDGKNAQRDDEDKWAEEFERLRALGEGVEWDCQGH
ncbi:hypothetical protein GJ744_009577 [Endocarpon pusillum]|uniref:Uncharacterized protein n=1 Tax=Endocarpon pusillum TaxID=364733 RepID=A0A8H7E627_9EURO|nr:hypothetical protein GJ744_009577 [Endocarpon pusillum]